jgi:hypothetical protein
MTTEYIQHEIREAKTWSGFCMLYVGAAVLSLLWVVLEPGLYSVGPVFFFMVVTFFQARAIGQRLGKLNDALDRQGKRQ